MILSCSRSKVHFICPEKPGVSYHAPYILEGSKRERLEIIMEGEGRLKTDYLMNNVMIESLLGYSLGKGIL